jgi:hypothetical protein
MRRALKKERHRRGGLLDTDYATTSLQSIGPREALGSVLSRKSAALVQMRGKREAQRIVPAESTT